MEIVALVIYADESVNKLDDWDFILSAEAKAAVRAGADALRERARQRMAVRARVG